MQVSVPHCHLGLRILGHLVEEMNNARSGGLTPTMHRKICISFRDTSLLDIFQLSLTTLRQLFSKPGGAEGTYTLSPAASIHSGRPFLIALKHHTHTHTQTTHYFISARTEEKLKELALSLSLRCLSFDFIGTTPDESASDVYTVQAPSSWRTVLYEPATLRLFVDSYCASRPPVSTNVRSPLGLAGLAAAAAAAAGVSGIGRQRLRSIEGCEPEEATPSPAPARGMVVGLLPALLGSSLAMGTEMGPPSWRGILGRASTLRFFLDLYLSSSSSTVRKEPTTGHLR